MLKILRVAGNSLFPLIQEGDFVIIFKIPFFHWQVFKYRPGDIVVLKHPQYGTLIKKVDWLPSDGKELFVVGTGSESIDSRTFGPVTQAWLSGKVICHIKNPIRKISV